MYYTNFDENITSKLGIVVEKWPLKNFCSPSDIKTRNKVQILWNSWNSGATCFQKLSAEEWKVWGEERFTNKLTEMDVTPPNDITAETSNPDIGHTSAAAPAATTDVGNSTTQTASNHLPDPVQHPLDLSPDENMPPQGSALPYAEHLANQWGGKPKTAHAPFVEFINGTVTSTDGSYVMTTKKP
jgi:hypothetical protein